MDARDFLIRRDDLSQVRWEPGLTRADAAIEQGEALLRIDRFSLTANNITYAVMGDA